MIRTIWSQLRPFIDHPVRSLLALAGLSTLGGLIEAAILVIVVNSALLVTSDSADPRRTPLIPSDTSLTQLLVVGLCLTVIMLVAHSLAAWLTSRMSSDVIEAARERAITAYLNASWTTQSQEREGSLQETMSTLAYQSSSLALWFAQGTSAALSLVTLLAIAAVVDWLSMTVVMVFGVLLFGLLRPISKTTNRLSSQFVTMNSEFSEEVSRTTAMAMELRLFGVEEATRLNISRNSTHVAQRLRTARFMNRFGASLYRDLALLFLLAGILLLNWSGAARTADIGAVVLLVVRALAYATAVQANVQNVLEQAPSLSSLDERIRALEGARSAYGVRDPGKPATLELSGVGYSYDTHRSALQGVDLILTPGEVVGIVGPSGSGKSTLLQVLLRLRPPSVGTLSINGIDYSEVDSRFWSRTIAFVPQEPRLMEGSIADNIRFLREEIDSSAVERAADMAHVGDEIRGTVDGFQTVLGPRGSGLSGGQKQRVAIARALVGQPSILVLDEPTSALDGRSELLLKETISELKGDVTIVIVAHRLTVLEVCDRVLHLENGYLTER